MNIFSDSGMHGQVHMYMHVRMFLVSSNQAQGRGIDVHRHCPDPLVDCHTIAVAAGEASAPACVCESLVRPSSAGQDNGPL